MLSILTQFGFNESQAQILADQFDSEITLSTGEHFLKEGKISNQVGLVIKGMCRHYYNTPTGEVTRWIVLSGNFTASLRSFISQVPSVENLQAMEECRIAVMSRANWLAIYEQHEFIRNFWTKFMEENYIGMEERVFNLIAKTAEERYQWMQENQPAFIREVPDKYLASMLGIHPRHLSRIRALRK